MALLYLEAGHVVDAVLGEKLGLKAALYRSPLQSDPRVVCKLASAALRRRGPLRQALAACGMIAGEDGPAKRGRRKGGADAVAVREEGVALVMAFDLLAGRGLKGGGSLKRELVANKARLEAAFNKAGGNAVDDPVAGEAGGDAGGATFADLPRYVRVNRCLVPAGEAAALRARLAKALKRRASEANVEEGDVSRVVADEVVPDVLVLHPRARALLQGLPDVDEGRAVLQDRSSCLSALAAGLAPGTRVLDACAAPGSKTAHAIALLQGKGSMIACERDPKRAKALVSRLKQLVGLRPKRSGKKSAPEAPAEGADEAAEPAEVVLSGSRLVCQSGAVHVEVRVGDFLKCNPNRPPFCDVEVLLVDPSCSGSGLPEHHLLDATGKAQCGQKRLRHLAAFQKRILAHALRFPRARTICYSTCSVHRDENEGVVEAVLGMDPKPPFKVVQALPWWKNGPSAAPPPSPAPPWADLCVRCDPAAHKCRGFFLCRLDRDGAAPAPAMVLRTRKRKRAAPAKKPRSLAAAAAPAPQAMCGGVGGKRAKRGVGIRITARR